MAASGQRWGHGGGGGTGGLSGQRMGEPSSGCRLNQAFPPRTRPELDTRIRAPLLQVCLRFKTPSLNRSSPLLSRSKPRALTWMTPKLSPAPSLDRGCPLSTQPQAGRVFSFQGSPVPRFLPRKVSALPCCPLLAALPQVGPLLSKALVCSSLGLGVLVGQDRPLEEGAGLLSLHLTSPALFFFLIRLYCRSFTLAPSFPTHRMV